VPVVPPACATAKFPANNASGVNPFGVFAWNHVQAAIGYRLYVGTDNPPTNVLNGQDVGYTDHYSFPQLQPSTAYYWMVKPYNSAGESVTCTPQYFVTSDTLTLPNYQAFTSGAIPPGWGQQYGGDVPVPLWTVENSNNAGGSPFELSGSWYDGIGSSRLVSPPFNIQGFSGIHVSFLQNYEDWGQGMSIQLQVSYDSSSWANLPYEIIRP